MMLPYWRRKRLAKNQRFGVEKINLDMEEISNVTIPTHFKCPISLDIMKDPVTLSTGITYDRESIERWIESGNETCPVTNQVLSSFDQIPNHTIRKMIQNWCVENKCYGVERIPTPRIPVSPYEVSMTCKRIMEESKRGDGRKCTELVRKMKSWGKESERNRKCVVENGSCCVLVSCFESFVRVSMEKHESLLSEVLSVLTWMCPFGFETQTKLGSLSSLNCISWFLRNGDFSERQNSVLLLEQVLAFDGIEKEAIVDRLVKIDGVIESLIDLIKKPIGPTSTKASISTISHLINSNETTQSRFIETGLVSLLVETLVDGDKTTCEKALEVLDSICESKRGREETYENDLIVPLLIKKILRISELGSEFCVSILLKLCRGHETRNGVVVEALQVGAFQKMLVLLQVGCGESTKGKAKELLKLLNLYRTRCLDGVVDSSLDFKYLKKPY